VFAIFQIVSFAKTFWVLEEIPMDKSNTFVHFIFTYFVYYLLFFS
jgi:hypothetical protein